MTRNSETKFIPAANQVHIDYDLLAEKVAEHLSPKQHICQLTPDNFAAVIEMASLFRTVKQSAKGAALKALSLVMWMLILAALSGIFLAIKSGLK